MDHRAHEQLDAKNLLGWEECFIDATFMPAKRGASKSGRLERGREQSAWWWQAQRVYRLQSSPVLRRLANRLSQSKRSQLYEYLVQEDQEGLGNFLKDLWRTEPTIVASLDKPSRRKASTSSRPT